MEWFEKVTDRVSKILLIIAGVALLASMLLVVYNAVIRNFTDPFAGTPEIAGILGMVAITFSLGYTQREYGNVGINILTEKLTEKLKGIVHIIVTLLALGFFGLVSVKLVGYGLDLMEHKTYLQTTGISIYPFVLLMAVGFFGLVLQLVYQLVEAVYGLKEGVGK